MILLYHDILPGASSSLRISVNTFEHHMSCLQTYKVVSLDDYNSSNQEHVVIAFDGVYENVWRYAFPILRKWGYPFELFVIGQHIGDDNAFNSAETSGRFATIKQLREMSRCGGRIQWHSTSHKRMGRRQPEEITDELSMAPGLAAVFPSPHLRWFAYAHGDYSLAVVDAVRARFECALLCVAGSSLELGQQIKNDHLRNDFEWLQNTLNAKFADKGAELSTLKKERSAAVELIAAMRATKSWRLTAPLRFIENSIRHRYSFSYILYFLFRQFALRLHRICFWLLDYIGLKPMSICNAFAITNIVDSRCIFTRKRLLLDPMCPQAIVDWPAIDICVVTYNSQHWIDNFVDSLLALEYPKICLAIRFVDNSSTDDTEAKLHMSALRLREAGAMVDILRRPNTGFGAGHNVAIRAGTAQFCLVTNIDLTFEPDSMRRVVAMAMADAPEAAAWEMRQKPYEHPKFYDPVTGTTNWNSHACVLLRRTAIEAVEGYDENLFMYGEDVELSYRLRRSGYMLRYCPAAVVWHYSYESSDHIKPLQYVGSVFANMYNRIKYGKLSDIFPLPLMVLRLLTAPEPFPGSRGKVLLGLLRLVKILPKVLISRQASEVYFPFRAWDYEYTRTGAFVEQRQLPVDQPIVSIITRTYRGRELFLRQALLSGAHQTWSNIEHIVVEDGGDSMRGLCEDISRVTGRMIRYISNDKLGRSKAGNTGLAAARGRWCMFLDDDDLLFSEHIEVLANALLAEPDAVASYTLALEVKTDTTGLKQGKYVEKTYRLPTEFCQDFDFNVLLHHNIFPIQSVLFERQLFTLRGGFFEDMDTLEDWTLWIRYAFNHRFVYVPKVTSMFRTPADTGQAKMRAMGFSQAYPLAQIRIQAWLAENVN